MVKDPDLIKIKVKLQKKENLIYGIDLIRKELRNTSPKSKLLNKNLRIALLSLYDEFVGKHTITLNDAIQGIAHKYYQIYKQIGGSRPLHEIIHDFSIIACASYKQMDIVVTQDKVTMLGELPLRSYKLVNEILELRTPIFWSYDYFKRWLL